MRELVSRRWYMPQVYVLYMWELVFFNRKPKRPDNTFIIWPKCDVLPPKVFPAARRKPAGEYEIYTRKNHTDKSIWHTYHLFCMEKMIANSTKKNDKPIIYIINMLNRSSTNQTPGGDYYWWKQNYTGKAVVDRWISTIHRVLYMFFVQVWDQKDL